MCLPNILFPVFMFVFIFYCRSFPPCWPLAFLIFSPPLGISMFIFLRNSSPLFSITRSSFFSVIHVNVNIKNKAERDTTLSLFFLSKSPGGHVISFQIKPWVVFGLPYLSWVILHWYACGADGRSLARSVYGHVITKFSRRGRLPRFLSYGAPKCRAWSSANTSKGITFNPKNFHREEPFHLNSPRDFRVFHINGRRSLGFVMLSYCTSFVS